MHTDGEETSRGCRKESKEEAPCDCHVKSEETAAEAGAPSGYREHPKRKAGVLSRLTFWWMEGLMRRGYRASLTAQDLPRVLEGNQSARLVDSLDRLWRPELERPRWRPRLWRALLGGLVPIKSCLLFALQRLLFSASFVSTPVIMCFFLRELHATANVGTLLWLVALFGIVSLTKSLTVHHSFHTGDQWSLRIKVALVGLIYKEVTPTFQHDGSINQLTRFRNLASRS